jgi:hypothetical protein
MFFRHRLFMCLACRFFCSRHARARVGEPDSRPKIFFHRQGREVLAKVDSSLDSNESVAALIRMREIPDRVCVRRRRVEEGSARRFAHRAIAPGTGTASDADENLHRDDLRARINHDERRS